MTVQNIGSADIITEKSSPTAEKATWGQSLGRGFVWLASATVGWQTSAIAGAWAPKLIIDGAIAIQGKWVGGLVTGPAAVKFATDIGVIGWAAGGVGLLASGGTALALYGTVNLAQKGVTATANAISQYRNGLGQLAAQHQGPDAAEPECLSCDDWNELFSPKDRMKDLEKQLDKTPINDFNTRLELNAKIGALHAEIGKESLKRFLG
ncbi:MAG: hypothetical protein H0T62_12945 [Parachlamydiaceae bacterium]|nr:hypothetical protein [Parachlamydiaceae bacterium]